MGELLAHGPQRTPSGRRARLGTLLFLAVWALLFAALLGVFGYLRLRAGGWPPPGLATPPWGLPVVNSAVLIAAGLNLELARKKLLSPRRWAAKGFLLTAWTLGALFLSLQVLLWTWLIEAGVTARDGGAYAAALYGLTGFHAAHVLVGLLALGWLSVRSLLGTLTPARSMALRLWALYWRFITVAWLAIVVQLFVW
jgi:cytochrome c oxidase subunit 3